MGIERIEVAVFIDQLGRRLLPHAGNAGQVVGGVAPQRGQQRVLVRPHPGPLLDAGLVVEGVVAHAPTVVQHPDVGILDQLVGVAVTGHDDHRMPPVPGLGGQRGQNVVSLVAFGSHHRDGQRPEDPPDHVELRWEVGWSVGPAALVVLHDVVPERSAGKIEGDGQAHRPVVPHQVHHHGGEPVDRVGDHTGSGGEVGREGEVGPEGERHTVQQDQRSGTTRPGPCAPAGTGRRRDGSSVGGHGAAHPRA